MSGEHNFGPATSGQRVGAESAPGSCHTSGDPAHDYFSDDWLEAARKQRNLDYWRYWSKMVSNGA